jgi:hypothetical protein
LTERRRARALWLLAAATACDPQVCDDDDRTSDAALHSVAQGSARVSGAGEDLTLRFLATLSGLPELWSAETIREGSVELRVDLSYQSAPVGGDGTTEMPSFDIDFDPPDQDSYWPRSTGPMPRNPYLTRRQLFEPCLVDDDAYCCRFGDPECALPVTIRIERVQGAPFPPVVVDWQASVSTRVNSCPEPNRAELTFEQEEP